ncbi:MAG: hypothetical protein J6K77_01375, partial [Ruminococcus sp.]|nr:hypothetical protein [Ruminococcus sp.]
PSQTLPEALPLDSAKGALPLLKPGFVGLRRLGTPSQTLPEALPLDSAKGTLSLWNPGVIRRGLCWLKYTKKSKKIQQSVKFSELK